MAKDKVFGPGLSINVNNISIGIDQSYSGFGITILNIDNLEEYSTLVFKAEQSHIDRLVWVREKLRKLLILSGGFKSVTVAMEGYAFGTTMAHMLGELGAIVKLTCYEELDKFEGKYPYIIPPTTLKKYITGKGTGVQKNQILLNVYKKWGVEFNDDNAADSYALAMLAAGKGTLAYELEILEKIKGPNFREKP
jgi:mannitol/fructose-specific phosphotransferase system IIA component (Ntr-type)